VAPGVFFLYNDCCFLQCIDTVSNGMDIWPAIKPAQLVPKDCLPGQTEEENWGGSSEPTFSGKMTIKTETVVVALNWCQGSSVIHQFRLSGVTVKCTGFTTPHHNRFTALFPGPRGWPHGLDRQHQVVDRTLWKSHSEWQRTEINGESTSMVWPTLGSRTAKEQNSTRMSRCQKRTSGLYVARKD